MRLFVAIALILFSLDLRASESTANLLLNYKSITGNETVLGGIHIKLPSGWHTYWINPGESGAPIKINFLFPKGFEPGEILYPTPVKHTVGGITSYVMEDETVLIFSIKTSSKLPNREYELKANVEWLECKEICRPASATVQNKIIVGTVSSLSTDAELLSKWQKRIPATNITLEIKAKWQKLNEDNKFQLILDVNSPYPISDFFPYLDKSVDIETSTIIEKSGTNEFRIKKNASLLEGVLPAQIGGVFTFSTNLPDGRNACEIKNILVDSQTISVAVTKNKMSFWVAVYLAFFGGIILNFMPCVLPVISLKVLSFINNSTQSAGKIRLSGIAFAIGVIASLLILAGFVVLIQATGKFAGWGIQFQNPIFLVLITTLVTIISLNLFGLFEVSISGKTIDKAATLASKQSLSGSFFHGALIVILATPCTAPFLGAALGYAFTQPPLKIFAIFFSIALGLSLPYMVICLIPSISKILPRPGQWMVRFKILMGFPMLATTIWLISILFAHYGRETVWIETFLLILSLALWLFGEFYQRNAKIFSGLIIPIILIVSGYLYALEYELDWRHPQQFKSISVHPSKYGINWQIWSPESVNNAIKEGKVVLVDFTADWCLTCKANYKTSLDIPSVSQKLKEIGAVAFIADYTLKDERILVELKKYNRAGVPLVLVYPKNKPSEPIVLPEVLTPSIVLDALNKAAQ